MVYGSLKADLRLDLEA